MTADEPVRLFWGKAGRAEPYRVHPAVFHMLDVGLVGRELVERAPAGAARRLAGELGLPPEGASAAIGFIVALHDLGKISPGFQEKVPPLTAEAQALGYCFPRASEPDHSLTTQISLARAIGDWTHRVARAIAAHHGSFHGLGFHGATCPGRRAYGDGQWETAREWAVAALADAFGVDAGPLLASRPISAGAAMILAGLTTLADWIGSDPSRFPPAEGAFPTIENYVPEARRRAAAAVEAVGWRPVPGRADVPGFPELFPGYTATPLQELAGEVARALSGPGIVLIEAPMGEGKTEAALYLARICMARFGHSGIYVALPTQATCNQMFGRFQSFLERGWDREAIHLHLLHGLASFHDAYDNLPHLPREVPEELTPEAVGGPVGDPGVQEARVYAAGWFRGGKRGLLAPFGVGTLDQGLMGVLPVRHMFLRLFGLANKVVILDEAHAYETYTTKLLVELVRWLRELGSTVVILSATLPARKRADLLAAYTGSQVVLPDVRYPRIAWAEPGQPPRADQPRAEEPDSAANPRRYIPPPLHLRPWPEPAGTVADEAARVELGRKLAAALAPGGCAAWFCNTVASAQETYLLLDSLPELRGRVRLLHAQLPVWHRRRREEQVQTRTAKGAPPGDGIEVWVSTQVMEQSLDVDFDAMVSELAPIDLLLQRAGRLHRHERRHRPAGAPLRILWWLRPAADETDEERPAFGVDARVYEPVYLLRTLALLRAPVCVHGDEEIEKLVEAVYGDSPPELPATFQELHARFEEEARCRKQGEQQQALLTAIPPPDSDDPFTPAQRLADEDDPTIAHPLRALTRLGDPTVTVVCAEETGGALLVPAGEGTVDPETAPRDPAARREWERSLLLSSVRLQHQGWVQYLAGQPVPRAWRDSPALRNCRLVRFRGGSASEGPGELRLHPVLGLVRAPRVLRRLGGT
ncbi:MAG: CRISPR-associated helicase Cas3' [Armatimonadetes bacterium]|nr:CRISPR-associated helicase Cas3' [Armatimonadota bacterium]